MSMRKKNKDIKYIKVILIYILIFFLFVITFMYYQKVKSIKSIVSEDVKVEKIEVLGMSTSTSSSSSSSKKINKKLSKKLISNNKQQIVPIKMLISSSTSSSSPTTKKAPASMIWGASVGKNLGTMAELENLVNSKSQIQMYFAHWGNDQYASTFEDRMGDKSKILLLFWEPIDYNKSLSDQADYSFDTVIAGGHDEYFQKFAEDAKKYGGEIILAPYSEFNGNWYPWSMTKEGNTSDKFKKSWIHIHGFFKNIPNVKFAWIVNSGSIPDIPSNQFDLYYPGSEYIDYVGVDGFNDGNPWESFETMFGKSLPKLEKYNKPVYIFSMGVADDKRKAGWIIDAFTVQLHKYPYVKGWLWFNENKEKDWRVNSNPESLEAFKSILN